MPKNGSGSSRAADTLELAPLNRRATPSSRRSSTPPTPADRRPSLRASPNSTPPHPILTVLLKHARDIRAISLIVAGVIVLLSLVFRSHTLALGAFLHALLGWGAPALGFVLIALGLLNAARSPRFSGMDVRLGLGILLSGFLVFGGLLHSSGCRWADGGDVGNGVAAIILAALAHIVGTAAALPCAHTLVGAMNAVGLLLVTDRPLSHWLGLLRGGVHAGANRLARARQARQDSRRSVAEPSPVLVSQNSPTVRSRKRAVVSAGDELKQGPVLTPLLDPLAPSGANSALFSDYPAAAGASGGAEGASPADAINGPSRGSSQRSRRSNLEDLLAGDALTKTGSPHRPTVLQGETAARPRSRFATALDTLLPAGELEPEVASSFFESAAQPGSSVEGPTTWATAEDEAPPEDLAAFDDAAPPTSSRRSSQELLEESIPEDRPAGADLESEIAIRQKALHKSWTPASGSAGEGNGDLPPAALLNETPPPVRKSAEEAQATVMTLERTLQEFKVEARVVEIAEGPTLTRYEIQLAPGILVKKILSLADNIAMALAAIDVRVEAPIPGKSAIGVEVPKRVPGMVGLRELVDLPEFRSSQRLSFALGRDVTGAPQYTDLAKMPHLLIAGSTGSGKSACLNTLIISLLYRLQPDELQFIMIDPKRVELSLYDGIPHLCHQIVRDCRRAPQALGRAMAEMDRRYLLLQELRTRDIVGYNSKVETADRRLPYIVIVIDELADLMMTSGAETEHAITRIAQLARAVGIHLVVATQRPSVDIVTGKIKANVSSRIAFAVSSGIDSRTILDCVGAERLIGRGDMLFLPIDASKPRRIQGAYVGEAEVERVVEFWKARGRPDYYLERTPAPGADLEPRGDAEDEHYSEAVRVVLAAGQASTSMLQRRLKIGYNRAATLIELMEDHGVVGPQDGVRPREVLISRDQWELAQEDD